METDKLYEGLWGPGILCECTLLSLSVWMVGLYGCCIQEILRQTGMV